MLAVIFFVQTVTPIPQYLFMKMAPFQWYLEDSCKDKSTYGEVAAFIFAAVTAVIMVSATYVVIGTQRASVLHDLESLCEEDEPLEESVPKQQSYDTFTGVTYRADSTLSSSSCPTKVMAPTLTVQGMPPHICSTAKQTLLTCSCIDRQILDVVDPMNLNLTNLMRMANYLENAMKKAGEIVKCMKLEPIAKASDFDHNSWLAALGKDTVEAKAFYCKIYHILCNADLIPKSREGEGPWNEKPIVYIAAALWLQAADMGEVEELIKEEKIRMYFTQSPMRGKLIIHSYRSRGGNDHRGA